MTQSASSPTGSPRTIDAVMKRVGAASRLFELHEIRFVDCSFSYAAKKNGPDGDLRIGIAEQEVALDEKLLHVSMRFEFRAPSPYKDDPVDGEKRVSIRAKLEVEYVPQPDRGAIDKDEAEVFGRVNGIYNSWPYLREYVQSSLVRLGLPPFELPLLRAGAAAHLAGLVDLPDEVPSAKPSSS